VEVVELEEMEAELAAAAGGGGTEELLVRSLLEQSGASV